MEKEEAEKFAVQISGGQARLDLVDGEYVVLFDRFIFRDSLQAASFVAGYKFKEAERVKR